LNELMLLLSAGQHRYALPCRRVREVIANVNLQPLPNAPAFVAGVFNYRGLVTPVLDACRLLAGQPCAARLSTRIVLFDCKLPRTQTTRAAGLLAERVTDTRRLDRKKSAQTGFAELGEVVIDEGQMITLLDLDVLVAKVFTPLLQAEGGGWPIAHALAEHHE